MLTRIVMTKAAAVAVVALSATGAAAATGNLPDTAQDGFARAAQHIGINLPSAANDKAREQTQHDDPNAEDATESSLPDGRAPATPMADTPAADADDGPRGRLHAARTAGRHARRRRNDSGRRRQPTDPWSPKSRTTADPEGGKGDEVAPVARDNHGAEVRAEHQPEHPVPDSPPEPGENAHSNKP